MGKTPQRRSGGKSSKKAAAAEKEKRDLEIQERESKKFLAGEHGRDILEEIVSKQKERRLDTKKRSKKMSGTRPADEESGSDGEESDGEASEEVQALRRIKAERKKLAKLHAEESDNEDGEKDISGEENQDDSAETAEQLNNALLTKLEEIQVKLPFSETMCIVADEFIELENVNDDLSREVELYKQALKAVKVGRRLLDRAKIPHMRPVDYFAEMIKSDEHMARIKQNLLFEKKKMEAFELRKKQQEYKKFAKQVQAEKIKEKANQKKRVKEVADEFRSKSKGTVGDTKKPYASNRKREGKNKKYGFGGKKDKRNSRESLDAASAPKKRQRR